MVLKIASKYTLKVRKAHGSVGVLINFSIILLGCKRGR